jgi:amino acid transporter
VGIYGYMGWAVNDLVTHYGGPSAPWWVWALGVLALVGFLGYRHIELSAKVLGVALVLEIAVVVIFDIAVFVSGAAPKASLAHPSPQKRLRPAPWESQFFLR